MLRLLLFLSFTISLFAQETMIREVADPVTDTHVEVLALFSKPSSGGYFPVRVKIANNLKYKQSVYLDFEGSSDFSNDLTTNSSFSFTADAGKTVTRDILVPLNPSGGYSHSGGGSSINVKLSGSMGSSSNQIRADRDNSQPSVLLSEALFTPNASTLDSETTAKYTSRYGSTEFAAKFDPKQLPDDWLAFSGYDSVIMTDADWSDIPPGGRNAILSWLRLGGQLILYSTGSSNRAALGLPDETSYGSIQIKSISQDLKLEAQATVQLVTDNPNKPQQTSLRNEFESGWPLQSKFGSQAFRYGLFIAVLVLFGILVGPINLFVFAKSGQRHRLFITTPLISLAASLLLIVLIIIQDGFGGNGMRRVLMEVRPDGDLNAAYLHQEQFCRTGVLTNSDFTIDTPVAFSPVSIADSRWARFTGRSGDKGSFDLQPEGGKMQASGDWFQSRSEHGHVLSAVISTRGRIEKTTTANTLISTFEYPIETLYYLDEKKQWHRAENINTGKSFTLTPIDTTMVDPILTDESNAFGERNQNFLNTTKNRPGHFVAITTKAPGINTNPSIRWKETRTIITGPIVSR
jgi:hypothetical protein